ncbi:Mu-like prophage major head subunit gpT family protein [Tropicimonas sp. S265A]|uniref:Mu-like prophage major head subunit gpT family protein n=1 Tax=Tropicimonas sp. S265A TaxID=3415134 RepID=UPI003C7DF567
MDFNTDTLEAVNAGIVTAFNQSLTGAETTYGRVAMTVRSTSKANVYPKLSDIPGMRKWVGSRHVHRLESDGFVIQNDSYENTIAVAVNDIADDEIGLYSMLAAEFGQAAAELPDELVWPQLESGFTETHYDGQFFFDTDHPVEDENGNEQSVSNFQGGSGAAWYLMDTRRVIMPIIFQDRLAAQIVAMTNLTDPNVFNLDELQWGAKRRCATGFGAWQLAFASKEPLTPESYADAKAQMQAMRGHKGRKLAMRPSLLVVGNSNESAAKELLKIERKEGGAGNIHFNDVDLHVETRLS